MPVGGQWQRDEAEGERHGEYCRFAEPRSETGNPQAFHQTITIAFLSLIAERMQQCGSSADFEALVGAYPELLDKRALSRWYPAERLVSEAARRTFLLPEPPL